MADPSPVPIPFCDAFNLRASPWGLIMVFGNQTDPGPDGQAAIKVFSQVAFSLVHAKTMVYIMADRIRQMEVTSGEHAMPPTEVLGRLAVTADKWKRFWGDGEEPQPMGPGALARMNGAKGLSRADRRRQGAQKQVTLAERSGKNQ